MRPLWLFFELSAVAFVACLVLVALSNWRVLRRIDRCRPPVRTPRISVLAPSGNIWLSRLTRPACFKWWRRYGRSSAFIREAARQPGQRRGDALKPDLLRLVPAALRRKERDRETEPGTNHNGVVAAAGGSRGRQL